MWIQTLRNYSSNKSISPLGRKTFICVFGPEHVFTIKHLLRTEWNLFHTCSRDNLNRQNPLNVFEALEHVLTFKLIILWAFIRCFALHTCSVAKCTYQYEIFPAQLQYFDFITGHPVVDHKSLFSYNSIYISRHESISGFYRVSSYFVAKIFADLIPQRTLPTVIFATITYWMIGEWVSLTPWELPADWSKGIFYHILN